MKLGVFLVLFGSHPFEAALDMAASRGIQAVEIGAGGNPGDAHCKPDELLESADKRRAFLHAVESRGLSISALSCHGNPLHPQREIAEADHAVFDKSVRLAEMLGVPVVNTFSGCPGDHEGAKYPNWPVAPWPDDFRTILNWQWKERIIPYWVEQGAFAIRHGVKIGIELHGGFSVHTPATLLRLRREAGVAIGANLDPSHMWWQGIDPVQAIRILGRENAIHHFHAKDTVLDPVNVHHHGVTDMQPYSTLLDRAWQFRTVGYGHDLKTWADITSALRLVGYDHAVSIEHEDGLMSVEEGLTKAVQNLKPLIIESKLERMYWG